MSGIGGSLLGKLGLGWFESGDLLGSSGIEGNPDGGVGAGIDDLLNNDAGDHYLINDAGDVLKIND